MHETERHDPRVLLISHPVLAKNTSMGRTMDTYFSGWPADSIAQLYIQSEVPTDPLCENYFRFTDPDALKSVFQRRRRGMVYGKADVQADRATPVDQGNLAGVYNYGRRRTPLIFLGRDTMWQLSGWKHSGMLEWAESFRPDVIFFASGDYAFSYEITRFLAERLDVPYVVCCFDDFYLFNPNRDLFLGEFRQNRFMKVVRETMDGAAGILTVNGAMAEAYEKLFGRKCGVVYTATYLQDEADPPEKEGIVYLGDVSLGRNLQLCAIADGLKECRCAETERAEDGNQIPEAVDVYTAETDPEYLDPLKNHPGIRFHGAVPGNQVAGIIRKAKAVIHTESFDSMTREQVRYSFSTKIPDCLAGGTGLLAFGPAEVASIDYLIRNDAAFAATSPEELPKVLERLFTDEDEYRRIIRNAKALAQKNHSPEGTRETVRKVLADAAKSS